MKRQRYNSIRNTLVLFVLTAALMVNSNCGNSTKQKTVFANYLKNSSWIINAGGLIAPDGEQTFYLSQKSDTAIIYNFHAVEFLDEVQFKSSDSWECGNDCFTSVYGRYHFIDTNRVKMEVDSIAYSGTCAADTKVLKTSEAMTFDIVKRGEQLELSSSSLAH
ncbi:MAG: hypothetical protein LBE37_04810 [Sphingobacterium sp.]|nr:hypothetical protein [Sphingobacterium sp.]